MMNGKDVAGQNYSASPHSPERSFVSCFLSCSEKMAAWRFLKGGVCILLPVILLLRYSIERFDYDVWWQMALGRYYLTHHTLVMDHSVFSWTPTDPTWIYNTCLGSIIFYWIYNLTGEMGLWFFQWLIFLGIFLSFYVCLRILKQPLDITAIAIIAAVGVICSLSWRFYKPELFSPLILCWLSVIYIAAKLKRKTVWFYIYPFVFALWVNLHGGFILGFCLLACFFTGELLNRLVFPEESFTTRELFDLGLACILSLVATLVNPYGIHYHWGILKAAYNEIYTVSSKYIMAYESLWPYLKDIGKFDISFFRVGQVALLIIVMLCTLVGLFLYQFVKKKSCDFTLILLAVATFWGSTRAVRAIYMFPLVFFFAFYFLIYKLNLKSLPAKLTGISLMIFVLLFFNVSYFAARYGSDYAWSASRLESFAPVQEVEFLKKTRWTFCYLMII